MSYSEASEFPQVCKDLLDALYRGQKNIPITDNEKTGLLKKLWIMDGANLASFVESDAQERKAYEFYYLTKIGVLN